MKNYQIISLDEQVDSDYDEELEKGKILKKQFKFFM